MANGCASTVACPVPACFAGMRARLARRDHGYIGMVGAPLARHGNEGSAHTRGAQAPTVDLVCLCETKSTVDPCAALGPTP